VTRVLVAAMVLVHMEEAVLEGLLVGMSLLGYLRGPGPEGIDRSTWVFCGSFLSFSCLLLLGSIAK
jgi:hypothetical protein